ncbi:MAG: citrate synthase protein [Frankiales bacterium]|nr:citrate synthase protein [Frankiales bacterium]
MIPGRYKAVAEFQTSVSQVFPGKVLIRGYSHEQIMRERGFAESIYLTMVGELPNPAQATLFGAMLNSLLDHGFVAATITAARYIASGNPQFIPAVAGGLLASGSNTLSPQHAFDMIDESLELQQAENVTPEEAAKRIVHKKRERKERFPGFGHPTHRQGDFRATVLFELADELGLSGQASTSYRAIHREFVSVSGRTDIPINIDGALACVGRDLGLSVNQTVGVAVLGVLPGLMAHVIEEIAGGPPLRFITDGEYIGVGERSLPPVGSVAEGTVRHG